MCLERDLLLIARESSCSSGSHACKNSLLKSRFPTCSVTVPQLANEETILILVHAAFPKWPGISFYKCLLTSCGTQFWSLLSRFFGLVPKGGAPILWMKYKSPPSCPYLPQFTSCQPPWTVVSLGPATSLHLTALAVFPRLNPVATWMCEIL